MALSPILGIPLMSANQNTKETTFNDAVNFLEKANNAAQTLNFASGDITLALLDIQRFFLFKATGATAARQLIIPSATKIFAIDNSLNAYPLTVVRGSSTLTLAGTTAGMIYIDGNRIIFLWYSANGGSVPFTFLSDAPHSYASHAGQFLRVNLTETGIDFAPAGAAVADFTDLSDVPSNYTGKAGQLLRVNASANGLEFLDKLPFTSLANVPTSFSGNGGGYLRVSEDETSIEFVLSGSADSFLGLNDTPDDYTGKGSHMVIVSPSENGLGFAQIPSWATNLTGLSDVPDSYSGAAGFFLRVNADGNGIEFTAANADGSADTFLQLDDVPVSYDGAHSFYLRVKADGTGLEFYNPVFAPDGGTTGQVLTKVTNADGAVAWVTPQAGTTLPSTSGQESKHLAVKSDGSGLEWVAADSGGTTLPSTTGKATKHLAVKSDESGVEWVDGSSLPTLTGNSTKHLAVKFDESGVEWVAADSGGGGGDDPNAHAYWRFRTTVGSGDTYTQCSNLKFMSAVGGTQLATGGTAIESGHYGVNVAANAFDGDNATKWESQSGSFSGGTIWVGYHFPSPVTIRAIEYTLNLTVEPDERPIQGVIEWSDNGTVWQTAFAAAFTWNGTGTYQTLVATDGSDNKARVMTEVGPLFSGDIDRTVIFTASSGNVTIPQGLPIQVGQIITILQNGIGIPTLLAGSGVTLRIPSGFLASPRAPYSVISIMCLSVNEYVVMGDMGTP